MDFALKKSFKSHGSYKQLGKDGDDGSNSPEKRPILLDNDYSDRLDQEDCGAMAIDTPRAARNPGLPPEPPHRHPRKNNDCNENMWRESSYQYRQEQESPHGTSNIHNKNNQNASMRKDSFEFMQGGNQQEDSFEFMQRGHGQNDSPTKMMGQLPHCQRQNKINSGEIALDVASENDETTRTGRSSNTASQAIDGSRELRVSFDVPRSSSSSTKTKTTSNSPHRSHMSHRDDQVLRCTSNMSFQRKSELLSRVKTRSRLQDFTPEDEQRFSGWLGKSGQIMKSGMLSKGMDDEEDDPLAGEDLPDEYRKAKVNALTLLQWISLILIVTASACSLAIPRLKKLTLWELHLWKWEVFLLVLICGRLVSGWGIRIIVFFIERNFLLRKRVLYFVYGLRKAVQNCLWLGLVLLAWHFLFDKRVRRETDSKVLPLVTKILVCFWISTFLWLIKTLMVKVLASSFHVSTYFDRIQESVFNQYVIETLSGPPVVEVTRVGEEEERTREELIKLQNAGATLPPDLCAAAFPSSKSGRIIGPSGVDKVHKSARLSPAISNKEVDNGITIEHLHKFNNKNISAWNMKRLIKIVRKASLSTLDEQAVENPYEDESTKQIRSEVEAKAAARKIFRNLARSGSKHIHLDDLLRFLPEDEAMKTLSLFEGATESKRISKSALKNWLVNAFRERRALALTLNDTKTAVNKLHQMVNVLTAMIIMVIWVVILEIATSRFLLFVSSQLVLLAFVFGNTCKTVFESIIFLFVVHPYDVGDRCEIDGVQMLVEEMNILTTIFLRYDNLKILYPNSLLWQKPIYNYYRSPDMGEIVEFLVHIATPAEKLAAVRQRISSYIDNNSEYWYPSPMIIVKELEDLNKVRIAIWPTHKMNHQDMGERFVRRGKLIEETIKILQELNIEYQLLPIDINVRTMPPLVSSRVPPGWTQDPS